MPKKAALILPALIIGLCACDGAVRRDGRDASTPSGFAVPRYVTLKFDEVNARSGPSDENRILWTYRSRGLPVQIVAETDEWRRICDPEGGLAWVKKSQIDGRRQAMGISPTPAPLRRRPEASAPPVAYLNPRALAALDKCEDGWCRLKLGETTGWAQAGQLWGAAPEPQCRGRSVAPARDMGG